MVFYNSKINFIEKFISHFQSAFSTKQWPAFRSLIYSMLFDYKRLSLSALANKSNISYQNLQYFASESKWSIKDINNIRLRLIQNQRTTCSTSKGVLAIDDTACPKPYAKKTEGAQFQHCSPAEKKKIVMLPLPVVSSHPANISLLTLNLIYQRINFIPMILKVNSI